MLYTKKNLRISCWNIHGYKCKGLNKFKDPSFKSNLIQQDIFCLQETHCDLEDALKLDEFPNPVHLIRSKVKSKKRKTKKRYGGLSVYVRNTIRPGVKFLEHATNDFIWIKLDKSFFGLPENLYICFVYNPPEYSSYLKRLNYNILELVENDVVKYSQLGKIMVIGDINARTSCVNDYIQLDSDKHVPLFDNYRNDISQIQRKSKDTCVTPRGRQLLSLCITSSLRILNGRTMGDLTGSYTCHQTLGSSTVDYMITSEDMIQNFIYFQVHNFLPDLSDHCQISCMLRCNTKLSEKELNLNPMPNKYVWKDNSVQLYQDAINSNEVKILTTEFYDKPYNKDNIEDAVNDLNRIFLKAADLSLKKKIYKPRSKNKKRKIRKEKDWQDDEISNLKKELYSKYRLMEKYNKDPYIRGSFFKCLKLYRKQRRSKIRKFKQEILNKLDNLYDQNPKAYWQLLDKLKKETDNNDQNELNEKIEAPVWQNYFESLNTNKQYNDNLIMQKLQLLENSEIIKPFNELDYLITPEEISKAIKSLKCSKASGFSTISNEMIKNSQHICIPLLKKLFNVVLSNGIYPKTWSQGYISPIHKSGSKYDPANYRGITITDNIGKLFNQILNTRLTAFLEKRNLINKEQIGFTKGCRTTDHMFVLNTIIQKYVKNDSKPLYACFVDLKRAFDSVSHLHLFYKLKSIGVGTKFYDIIHSMYKQTETCVKIGQHRTNFFKSNIGVRQGDNLSPCLFNIFLNDLPTYFDHTCDQIQLGSHPLSILMYADDVVLLSTSKKGLQNCVNKLFKFTSEWKLTVNTNKTKVLVFNKGGRKKDIKILLGNDVLECVQNYTYLGVNFTASGSFEKAKKELHKKGMKALFKLRKTFMQELPKPNTLMHIYSHTIQPILLYGSEIWGYIPVKKQNDINDFITKEIDKLVLEKIHMKMCKYTLGVNRRTSNVACRGELGSYPTLFYIIKNMVNYWLHLVKEVKPSNTILYEAIDMSQNMTQPNKESWMCNIRQIFKYLNMESLFEHHSNFKLNYIKGKVKNALKEKFNKIWENALKTNPRNKTNSGNKLRTYRKFKNIFMFEPYLNINSQINRQIITKFRTSCHDLEIERGRYNGILAKDRICQLCKKSVEDEFHFLFKCNSLKDIRFPFIDKLTSQFQNVKKISDAKKFIWIMASEDLTIVNMLSKLLIELFEKRKKILNNI